MGSGVNMISVTLLAFVIGIPVIALMIWLIIGGKGGNQK